MRYFKQTQKIEKRIIENVQRESLDPLNPIPCIFSTRPYVSVRIHFLYSMQDLKILEREIVPPGRDQILIPIVYFIFIYFLHKILNFFTENSKDSKNATTKQVITLSNEFLASFSMTSLILIKYDWDMYFGAMNLENFSTPIGTFIQCLFLAEISNGIGDPVLYYFSEMIKSNGFLHRHDLYHVFAVQITGSIVGGLTASYFWSMEISKMHWVHQMNYFDKPVSSISAGLAYGIFFETSAFFMLYLCDKAIASRKFDKLTSNVSSKFGASRIKNVTSSLAITGAVIWCVRETGAPLSPTLALGMNLYVWRKQPMTHLLTFWIFPAILMHFLALFETSGKGVKVSEGKKKMLEKIRKKVN